MPLVLLAMVAGCVGQNTPGALPAPDDYSGMYSFLNEGEFMQVTIEDKGKVSGFISRYGDTAADQGTFIDQFFASAKLDERALNFETESIHGVTFSFQGSFDRGPGKKPEEEGYYLLRGTLTRNSNEANGKTSRQARQVEFRSFPRDSSPAR